MPRPIPDHGFMDLPPEQQNPHTARVAVIPVPYDKTSSWIKGADDGPAAIIKASAHIEYWEAQTGVTVGEMGIVTREPVLCDDGPEQMAALVRTAVDDELKHNKIPVVIGGEHSVSIGAIEAAAAHYDNLTVLQIDAHTDTRDSYEGSTHNHACVMARAREHCPIVQVGLRAVGPEELPTLDKSRVVFAHEINSTNHHLTPNEHLHRWLDAVCDMLTDNVYLTIDLDAFDPSLVPATGTPEPNGMTWQQVIALVDAVCARSHVVGFDIVELCPQAGMHASDFIAAKLVQRVLCAMQQNR